MRITWYGHAAFLLESDETGRRVVLDPYRSPDVGTYAPIDDWADIVATSHDNPRYHSFADGIGPRPGSNDRPVVIDGLALLERPQPAIVGGVSFSAVRVFEDESRAEPISMVRVAMDGINVLHMGDCGHGLTPDDITACGRVDVLLALAGGPPTLKVADLAAFVEALRPAIVIPMHFGNERINLNLLPVSGFLALQPRTRSVRHADTPTVRLTKTALPTSTEVWVLPPAR